MSFSKNDLDEIKFKLPLSKEIEKKTKVIRKGKDYWCSCLFHNEKTPSCKINDDLGSYYCFGCGAKGDIFSLYTDLYNYSFFEAVKELSIRAGVKIKFEDQHISTRQNNINKILELTTVWFENNLHNFQNNDCKKYLETRNLNEITIKFFRLGFSYNPKTSLYNFLKSQSFQDDEILQSKVVKYDKNNKIRDFFYNRLIFPIINLQGKVVGFGGRALDDSNPKYINSPESSFFQKKNLLYNLIKAKEVARKKNNLLICEGYMDVISLYQIGIKTVVAPLGTSFTENQLTLAWKYSSKPTVMFDGDPSGIKASYRAAIMSLPFLTSEKFLQFVYLPNNLDPDSYLKLHSFEDLIKLLRNPLSLVNFIFKQSSNSLDLAKADEKIIFDKYLDDIVSTIKDKKVQYFYKNEFKNLFFSKLKNYNKPQNYKNILANPSSLLEKQTLSFIAAILNHQDIRKDIISYLNEASFLGKKYQNLINYFKKTKISDEKSKEIIDKCENSDLKFIMNKSLENNIKQLFPFAGEKYSSEKAKLEIENSVKNLNTRLLNLKKINKSLDNFVSDSNSLNWSELQKISQEIHSGVENE